MTAAEEPEELVEAAAVGMKLGMCALMPLADDSRYVTSGVQRIGQGRFRQRQTLHGVVELIGRVEFVAEPLLVATREKSRARGTAHRIAHIAAGATHARG